MKMVVPHILITGGTVVLARGDSLTPKDIPHGVRQATRGTKEVAAKVVRDVQHVLIVAPRYHQAVALYSSVVVSRNQSEHVGIHQDNGGFWRRRWKRLSNTAERTLVPRWSILHKAYPENPVTSSKPCPRWGGSGSQAAMLDGRLLNAISYGGF